MRRLLLIAALALSLLLAACGQVPQTPPKLYEATFLEVFDTVTTIKGAAESQEAFAAQVETLKGELTRYHRLFDIYNSYEGITNLKTLNDNAGGEPLVVNRAIIDLLLECKAYDEATHGRVNAAMGSVLRLWHEARNDGLDDPAHAYLPDQAALEAGAAHMDLDGVVIDEEASTVAITDPLVQLDVGAIAKGWSVQRVAELAPEGWLLSVGGNVCATGPKDASGAPWVVGVQNPDGGSQYLHTLELTSGSLVTSGDYQRGYAVDGKYYHHIIDPDTLYPGAYWRSVTILCADSGLADALSTALFLMDQQQGQELLTRFEAEALWVDAQGQRFYSPGFRDHIRN